MKEGLYYHNTLGTGAGQYYNTGKHSSLTAAIKFVRVYNTNSNLGTELESMIITKLFQYKNGKLFEVWSL